MLLQISWRNIWRNPRRTTVILIAVVIGVWSMIFLGALMRGISDRLVQNGIATLTGHIQIQHPGFRSDPVVENRITDPQTMLRVLRGDDLPPDTVWTPRVRVNAVANNARHSRGVVLVGIDPPREAKVSFIAEAVTRGRYLRSDDPYGIVIGQALAATFETGTGNKLVLMSADTADDIASRAFRIVGIFQAETEAVEKQFVFVDLDAAQSMLSLGADICEVSILLPENQSTGAVAERLRRRLDPNRHVVFTWRELLPLVTAVLQMYDGFILIWFLTVFVAMGFGLVNTILMAVFERIREFGLLRAMGMKPGWVVAEVLAESFFLLLMGLAAGNLLGVGTVLALSRTGIDLSAFAQGMEFVGMPRVIVPALHFKDWMTADLTVLILGVLVSLYPAIKAARITPVEAMAHV